MKKERKVLFARAVTGVAMVVLLLLSGCKKEKEKEKPVYWAGKATAVAAGTSHSLALIEDGTLWSWGYNGYGQLGNGTITQYSTPAQVVGLDSVGYLSGVKAIAAGTYHSLALMNDGTVWAWGYNGYGQLGDNSTTYRTTPVQVAGLHGNGYLSGVKAIAASGYWSLALKNDNTVWAWGYNGYGQLGNGEGGFEGDGTTAKRASTPVQVLNLTGVTAIAAGGNHALAVQSDGTVWAWGLNYHGQLGNNTTTKNDPNPVPVQVLNLNGVMVIAGGDNHSLALKGDGTLWAWGSNDYGQLGNNTGSNSSIPVQVVGKEGAGYLTGITEEIEARKDFSLALMNDGTIRAWGYNFYGQLGNKKSGYKDENSSIHEHEITPVQVLNLTGTTAIAAGGNHTLAIMNDGTIRAWGYNGSGQLGNGSTTNTTTAIQVTF